MATKKRERTVPHQPKFLRAHPTTGIGPSEGLIQNKRTKGNLLASQIIRDRWVGSVIGNHPDTSVADDG